MTTVANLLWLATLRARLAERAAQLDETAQALAGYIHAGQRYGAGPYVSHCIDVRNLIAEAYPGDDVLKAAAVLHDAIEDAPADIGARALILQHCGPDVLALVEAVTDEPGANRAERKAKTLPKTAAAGWRAVAIKLADRLCNSHGPKADMYRRELPAFKAALYPVTADRPELAPLWAALEAL
jgi:(p)ppGpp synthase/HD superfamily hydrolase